MKNETEVSVLGVLSVCYGAIKLLQAVLTVAVFGLMLGVMHAGIACFREPTEWTCAMLLCWGFAGYCAVRVSFSLRIAELSTLVGISASRAKLASMGSSDVTVLDHMIGGFLRSRRHNLTNEHPQKHGMH